MMLYSYSASGIRETSEVFRPCKYCTYERIPYDIMPMQHV